MADRGRYDYDIATGNRSYGGRSDGDRDSGGNSGRGGGSMFGGGGSRGDESDRSRDDRRGGVGWTQERENFSWGRDKQGGERDMHREQDRRHEQEMRREQEMRGANDRDQGKRMSSGWGGLAGEKIGRDREHHGKERGHDEHREHMDNDWKKARERDRERNPGYGSDDRRDGLPIEETSRLIASNKVEGTAVYGRDGHRLGNIYNFMVDKLSGKVEYAVMGYGGMLGMGTRYYPLPWEILTYHTREGGYRIEMTERDLRDAPSFDRDTEPQFNRSYDEHVSRWYGLRRK